MEGPIKIKYQKGKCETIEDARKAVKTLRNHIYFTMSSESLYDLNVHMGSTVGIMEMLSAFEIIDESEVDRISLLFAAVCAVTEEDIMTNIKKTE